MNVRLINTFLLLGSLLIAVNSATNSHPLAAGMSSVSESNIKIVDYDYVKNLKNKEDVLLIDVREPSELKETGIIPGSINVPSGEVENVLKNVSPDEFAKRFGRQKPDLDFPVVFSCRSGKRSEAAAHRAVLLGFKDVSNYSGGWLDWEEKMKQ